MKPTKSIRITTEHGREDADRFAIKGRIFFKYQFVNNTGLVFTCTAPTLIACRCKRDNWLERHGEM